MRLDFRVIFNPTNCTSLCNFINNYIVFEILLKCTAEPTNIYNKLKYTSMPFLLKLVSSCIYICNDEAVI